MEKATKTLIKTEKKMCVSLSTSVLTLHKYATDC